MWMTSGTGAAAGHAARGTNTWLSTTNAATRIIGFPPRCPASPDAAQCRALASPASARSSTVRSKYTPLSRSPAEQSDDPRSHLRVPNPRSAGHEQSSSPGDGPSPEPAPLPGRTRRGRLPQLARARQRLSKPSRRLSFHPPLRTLLGRAQSLSRHTTGRIDLPATAPGSCTPNSGTPRGGMPGVGEPVGEAALVRSARGHLSARRLGCSPA